jgi:hypothetical protein
MVRLYNERRRDEKQNSGGKLAGKMPPGRPRYRQGINLQYI